MKILFVFLTAICMLNERLHGQFEKRVEYGYSELKLGVSNTTSDSISAKLIFYDRFVKSVYYDSITNCIITPLIYDEDEWKDLSDDLLTAYSLDEQKLLWSKLFAADKKLYSFLNNQLLLRFNNSTYCVNIKNLENKFEVPGIIYQDENLAKIGVGLSYNKNFFGNKKGLFAINTADGTIKWNNENIRLKSVLFQQSFIDKNHLIFISDKLYGLNLETGESWENDHPYYVTSSGQFYPYIFGGIIGAVAYNLSMNAFEAGKRPYLAHCSNFIPDDESFWIANDSKLLKFDFNGKILVESYFPLQMKSSFSKLIKLKDKLVVISYGYTGVAKKSIGNVEKPFVGSFDYDGKLIGHFPRDLGFEKLEKIIYSRIMDDHVILIDKKSISNLSLSDYNLVKIRDLNENETKEWKSILDDTFYVLVNGKYTQLDGQAERDHYVLLVDATINRYSEKFELKENISQRNVFKKIYSDQYMDVLQTFHDKETVLLTKGLVELIKLKDVKRIIYSNGKYFIAFANGVYVIDKAELLR